LDISGNITIGGSPVGTSATISGLPDVALKFIAPVRKNLSEMTKTLQADYQYAVATPNTVGGESDTLNVADVVELEAVYMSSSLGTPATTSDLDVTNRYELDGGQRDNFYDVGRIRLKRGANAPAGQLLVVVDYFTHGAGDYFSVDSYTNIAYEDIPDFSSAKGSYNLRDVIDFRPRIGSDGTTFDSAGGSTVDMIKPNSLITADVQYYLPRRDKLYVDYRGNFRIVKGVPAIAPKYPEVPDDGMALYNLEVSPYTFTPSDIIPQIIDNRRYTMRDIGKIDKRVSNLEYYTSLSLLEKETADTQIFDAQGERFKNGFVVDGFYGHNIGDVTNPDYIVAMDRKEGTLRPHFHEDSVRMVIDQTNSANVVKSGPLVTLPFTEMEYVSQPYASRTENLNPYYVVQWDGNLELSPSTDEWKDTETRPEVVINETGSYDAIKYLAEDSGVLGTEWNEWQTNWTGREIIREEDNTTETSRNRITTRQTEAQTTTSQTRAGIRTELTPDTVTTSLGERVVDINFVPFIRSRKVYFGADRLKPNTKLNLFFDGVNINQYARTEASFVSWSDVDGVGNYAGATNHPDGSTDIITDSQGRVTGSFVIPSNDAQKFRTGSRVVRLIDNTNDVETAKTYAEATYTAQGLLQTRQGTTLSTTVPKFEVSEVSDRRVLTERVVSNQVISVERTRNERSNRVDPLAQTFFVDMSGGMFATSLDVYFKTKSATSPMICQLRTVENGYPTTTVIPFGEKVLQPADVNVSEDATVATTVTFDSPVYLQDQVEYCFVLKALDTGYEAWTSELGGFDVTDVDFRITDQPHSGVLFKSANAATWTAEQFKDLKFKINRATFDTETDGTLQLHNAVLPTHQLGTDPLTTYNGSNIIRVAHRNHSLFNGSNVTLSGVVGTINGIADTEINGIHSAQNVEYDSYEIVVGANATADGRAGGSVVDATENRLANLIHPMMNQIILPNTGVDWSAKMLTGQSLASPNEQPYNFGNFFDVIVNKNVQLSRLHCVASPDNQLFQSDPVSRPLLMKGVMASDQENLSPVVDLDRASVVTVANRIDNPSDDAGDTATNYITDDPNGGPRFVPETAPRENTGLSRYITRKIVLAESADDLKIFLLANRPSGSDIRVYYKLETDDTPFDDRPWIAATPDSPIVFSEDASKYNEIEYSLDDVGPFKAFSVKIVLTARNTSTVPTVRDFRSIALSS
jgi:hypothetical protein